MARCRQCGTEIPDGAEYCDECFGKLNTAKSSESYLDSLLSAVMTEEPKRREVAFQKKEAGSPVSVPKKEKREDTVPSPAVVPKEEEEFPDLDSYSIFDDTDEAEIDRMLEYDLFSEEESVPELPKEDTMTAVDLFEEELPVPVDELPEEDTMTAADLFEEELPVLFDELSEEDTMTAADLFGEELPVPLDELPEEDTVTAADLFGDEVSSVPDELFSEPDSIFSEEELQDGLSQDGDDMALDELLADVDGIRQEASDRTDTGDAVSFEQLEADSDFADFFAEFGTDAQDMFELDGESGDITDFSEMSDDENISAPVIKETKDDTKEPLVKEKKRGKVSAFFHKLFDNVKIDPSKIKPQPTKEEIEAKKKAAKEEKERSKEEKEAEIAERKAQERQLKLEKQKKAKEAKAEKKARKLEEAKLLLEEMEGTRINRTGASIVFIFFAMIAVVIVVGTSIFSYSLSIRNAQYEFDRDEYTLAYNEIFGLEVKDEDIVLYDRIMTVMYVQKQLNSYYNYYEMKDYPKALDSLLKGLKRYEKYIELAIELEIESDLDSVRGGILEELEASFLMTEQEAMQIVHSDSQVEYSKKVYAATEGMEPTEDAEEEE